MRYLANFVLLSILYQAQCQRETLHNYITNGGAEIPLLAPPSNNNIFTLENSQGNLEAVFQPEKSTVAPHELVPPHPASYQIAFGPPAFLDQRPLESKFSPRNIQELPSSLAPTEEKYKPVFGLFDTKTSETRKLVSKRESPSEFGSEVPLIPTLHFSVLPSTVGKNDFNGFSSNKNDDNVERKSDSLIFDSSLQSKTVETDQSLTPLPQEKSDLEIELPAQLSSLLPIEDQKPIDWKA